MLTIYRTTLFVLSLTVILPLKATTTVTGYLNEEQQQIATLLPPPPSTDTPQNRADLQAVLTIQAGRMAEQVAKAKRMITWKTPPSPSLAISSARRSPSIAIRSPPPCSAGSIKTLNKA